MVQEKLLLGQSGEHDMGVPTSVFRPEETCLCKGSRDNDIVVPDHWKEPPSPLCICASNYDTFISGNTSPPFPHS